MSTAVANSTRFPKPEGLILPAYEDIWTGFKYFQTQYAVAKLVRLHESSQPIEVEVFEVEPHTIIDDVLNLQTSVLSTAIDGHGDEIQPLGVFNRNALEVNDKDAVNASLLMLGLQALNKVQYPASENVNSTTFDTSIQKLIEANNGSFELLVASLDVLNATVTSYISEYQETILETLKLKIDTFEQSKLERLFRDGRVLHTLGYRISFEKDDTGRIKPIFERADFKLDAQDGKFRLSQKPLEAGNSNGNNVTVKPDINSGYSSGSRNPKMKFVPVALISLFILASCLSRSKANDMIIPTQTPTPKTDAPLSTDIPVTPTYTPFELPTNTSLPMTAESTVTSTATAIPEATAEPSSFVQKLLARMKVAFANYGNNIFNSTTPENKGVRDIMAEICLHLNDPKWLEENLAGFPDIFGLGFTQGSIFPETLQCSVNKESVQMLEKMGFTVLALYVPGESNSPKIYSEAVAGNVYYTMVVVGDVPEGTPESYKISPYSKFFVLPDGSQIDGDFSLPTSQLEAIIITRLSLEELCERNISAVTPRFTLTSREEKVNISSASFK